jgi:C1A family cysteine protease
MPIGKLQRQYTWKKQPVDDRDYTFQKFKLVRPTVVELPISASNQTWCSPVKDQGQEGSCTGHAWSGLLEYNEIKDGLTGSLYTDFSRAFVYYNERLIENTVDQDSGAMLRDGAKALANYGICTEVIFPYVVGDFAQKPSQLCYDSASINKIHSYYALNTITDMKTCIASGQCFVFGINIYESFESETVAQTGIVPMPNLQTEQCLGGHAIMAVAYNDVTQTFTIKNSWGPDWGQAGYFTLPYAYITNPQLASDFWTVVKDI